MLTGEHLSYLQIDFQIHRLLEKSDPESPPMLLKVSAEILATLLKLGSFRDRAVFLRHDFSYLVSHLLSRRYHTPKADS